MKRLALALALLVMAGACSRSATEPAAPRSGEVAPLLNVGVQADTTPKFSPPTESTTSCDTTAANNTCRGGGLGSGGN